MKNAIPKRFGQKKFINIVISPIFIGKLVIYLMKINEYSVYREKNLQM